MRPGLYLFGGKGRATCRFNNIVLTCQINCREFLVCIKDWLLQLWESRQYLPSVSGDLTPVKSCSSRILMMNQRKVNRKYY